MTGEMKEKIMLAAMEGDLKQVLFLGRQVLDRPLLLGDNALTVMGWEGPAVIGEGAAWEDYIRAGIAPDFQWSDDLLAANRLELPHGFFTCRIAGQDGRGDWVTDIPCSGGRTCHLVASGMEGAETAPPGREALGLVCLAIRNCVNNREVSGTDERFSTEQLLLQLIRTERFDEPTIRRRAQTVHMESEGFFSLLLLGLKDYHPQRNSVATIRSRLASVISGYSVIDGDRLVFLVSYDSDDPRNQRELWEKVEQILEENKLFGVFSRSFYRLGEFHDQYNFTHGVLRLRFCAEPGRYLVSCDEMAIYSLISSMREQSPAVFAPHPVLRRLLQSDRDRKTGYVETLAAYLKHAQKPVPACRELHIHRNTLDYRLRRMEELTDLDWEDGELMFRLYFGLCTLRYDQLTGGRTG